MPERVALKRVIIGRGDTKATVRRHEFQPGEIFDCSAEEAAHLDATGMVRKRGDDERDARREARMADRSALERVAKPVETADKRTDGNGNVTRDPPLGRREEDEL